MFIYRPTHRAKQVSHYLVQVKHNQGHQLNSGQINTHTFFFTTHCKNALHALCVTSKYRYIIYNMDHKRKLNTVLRSKEISSFNDIYKKNNINWNCTVLSISPIHVVQIQCWFNLLLLLLLLLMLCYTVIYFRDCYWSMWISFYYRSENRE